ncbi:MAG TPA: hypothetical protein PLX33_04810 [Alphaproteobacteria bacterium]|nr:hypothetical protein [Alphaproteobacteria bacterium]
MQLTVTSKGFFKKEFIIARDGVALAKMGVLGMEATLTASDGTAHQYVIETQAQNTRLALICRSGGADVARLEPMTVETVLDGVDLNGRRYGLERMENKEFSLRCDGRPIGTLTRRGGWFSRGFVIDAGQDIPAEAAGLLVFMAMAYPALRIFAYSATR